jgi:hypothetical protein
MTGDGAILADPQPEQFVAGDGWFAILGLGFGLLAALAVWFVAHRQRGPVALVAVSLGAVGAGLLAWWVGRHIGLTEYQRLLERAPVGREFGKPTDLRAHGSFLIPAFVASAAYTLLAGWARHPSLQREAEREGGPAAAGPVSWGSSAPPAPTTAPAPPAPDRAAPPPD